METIPTTNVNLTHDLFKDACWLPANAKKSHFVTVAVNLPPNARLMGPPPQIEVGLARIATQDELLRQVFYGAAWRDARESTGLASYFGSADPKQAQSAANVLDAGGRGRFCASAFLVCWAPHSVFMSWASNSEGELFAAIVPADWRYVVRVANIDTAKRDANLASLLLKAVMKTPSLADRAALYVGPELHRLMEHELGTGPIASAVPVRCVEVLRSDESVVEGAAA